MTQALPSEAVLIDFPQQKSLNAYVPCLETDQQHCTKALGISSRQIAATLTNCNSLGDEAAYGAHESTDRSQRYLSALYELIVSIATAGTSQQET